MEEHPYSQHLEGRELRAILTETPNRLRLLLATLSPEEIDRSPAPGKWSLREIMTHIADCEIAWSWRIRQTLASDNPTLQPFDQDHWGERYRAYDFTTAQTTFEALRAWNLCLLTTITDTDKRRPVHHPEQGDIRLETLLGTLAGHDLHHLKQLENLLRRENKQAVPSPS